MRLRTKTLLVSGATLLGLISVLYAASSNILLGSLKQAEEQNTKSIVNLVFNVFNQTKDDFGNSFFSWSAWDDSYNFIVDKNSRYIESNLSPQALAAMKVNLVLYVNPSNEIVFGTGFDLKTQKKTLIPQVLLQLQKSDRLLQHRNPQSRLNGILLLPEGVMMITSQPIIRSNGSGPIRGTLVMGRYLDDAAIDKLAKVTGFAILAKRADDFSQLPADFQTMRRSMQNNVSEIRVRVSSSETIAGYTLLTDIYGQPAMLLRVDVPRDIYKRGKHSQRYLIASILLVGVVFGGMTLLLLERLILSRLTRLSAGVKSIGASSNLSMRVKVTGFDELSSLADEINQMLQDLEQAESEQRESQERYRAVVEQASEGIFLIDADTKIILEANAAFEQLIGYISSEIGQLTVYDIVESDRPTAERNIQQIKSQKQHACSERYRRKNNSLVDVEVSANLISYGGREVMCIVARDITTRKQAEKSIHLLQTITHAIDASSDFNSALEVALSKVCAATDWNYGEAWIKSADQSAVELTPAWYTSSQNLAQFRRLSQEFIYPPESGLAGRVWVSKQPIWVQDVSRQPEKVFFRAYIAIEFGLKAGVGVPIIADGEVLAVLVFFMFEAKQEDKQLIELVSAVAMQLGSVIQRKRTEEALRLAEEKYRSIFENAVDGIFQTTPDRRYLSANAALAHIYGYESPAEMFASVTDIDSQYVDPNHRACFTRLMQEHGEVIQFESQVYRKDRSVIWITENARAISDPAGKLLYYEGTIEDITERKVAQEALRYQREQSEQLLLNILPESIAQRLKLEETTIADSFAEVTVLFADIVSFTQLSAHTPPRELVDMLNQIFSAFDELAEKHNLEKIKTIGDAYMVVGGLPNPRADHAEAIANMALDMQTEISRFRTYSGEPFTIRIGINTGPVVAGVIGIKKFIYDLWGDTVNTASRMESHGLAGSIQVTSATYEILRDKYFFEERGIMNIKGKGDMKTYFLLGKCNNNTLFNPQPFFNNPDLINT